MPHKYVAPEQCERTERCKQHVLGHACATLPTQAGAAPVVATTERECITVWWWDARSLAWRAHALPHAPLEGQRWKLWTPNRWTWSRTVGLAAARDVVLLVHKRAVPGGDPEGALLVETFKDAGDAGGAVLGEPERAAVPLAALSHGRLDAAGHSVWAAVHDDGDDPRLVVVAQAVAPREGPADTRLVVLRARIGAPLDEPGSWDVEDLGRGGYDLDARLEGSRLTVVHRRRAAAVRFSAPFAISGAGAPGAVETGELAGAWEPLELLTLDLGGGEPVREDIPGGEHPQLHRADPPLVTFDRISAGRVTVRRAEQTQAGWSPQRIDWRSGGKAVFVAMPGPEGWAAGVLQQPDSRLPRNLVAFRDVQEHVEVGAEIAYASTFRHNAVQLVRSGRDEERKVDTVDFLLRRAGMLVVERFTIIRPDTPGRLQLRAGHLVARSDAYVVWDLNHLARDPDGMRPGSPGENGQFAPFSAEAPPRRGLQARPPMAVDVHLGGALAVDPAARPLTFVAYTDLGDGGCRVVFDPALEPPEPVPGPRSKDLVPEIVPGPGARGRSWVRLTSPAPWEPTRLPAVAIPAVGSLLESLGSALVPALDQLLSTARQTIGPDGQTLDTGGLTVAELDRAQAELLGSVPTSSPHPPHADASSHRVSFTVTPGAPAQRLPLTLTARLVTRGSRDVAPATATFPRLGFTIEPDPVVFVDDVGDLDPERRAEDGWITLRGRIELAPPGVAGEPHRSPEAGPALAFAATPRRFLAGDTVALRTAVDGDAPPGAPAAEWTIEDPAAPGEVVFDFSDDTRPSHEHVRGRFRRPGSFAVAVTFTWDDGTTRRAAGAVEVEEAPELEWVMSDDATQEQGPEIWRWGTTARGLDVVGRFLRPGSFHVQLVADFATEPSRVAGTTLVVHPTPAFTWDFSDPAQPPALPTPLWTFTDLPAGEGAAVRAGAFAQAGTIRVALTATVADGTRVAATHDLEVAPAGSNAIWSLWEALNALDDQPLLGGAATMPMPRIGAASLTVLKYGIAYSPVAGAPGSVVVTELPEYDTQSRFTGSGPLQGTVDLRLRLAFTSSSVTMRGNLAPFVRIDSIAASMFYGRPFTPGVLISERRSRNPVGGGATDDELVRRYSGARDMLPTALTAKPAGDTWLEPESASVSISLTPTGATAVGIAAIAAIVGVVFVALAVGVIAGLRAAAAVAAIGIVAVVAARALLPRALFGAVARYVEAEIVKGLPAQRGRLDDAGLLDYAGEGLAEALAIRVMEEARAQEGLEHLPQPVTDRDDRPGVGRNRFWPQLFETIFVREGSCHVLVRTEGIDRGPPDA